MGVDEDTAESENPSQAETLEKNETAEVILWPWKKEKNGCMSFL